MIPNIDKIERSPKEIRIYLEENNSIFIWKDNNSYPCEVCNQFKNEYYMEVCMTDEHEDGWKRTCFDCLEDSTSYELLVHYATTTNTI